MSPSEWIRTHRARLGLSQRELAKRLRITHGAISQWENEISRPSLDHLLQLARIFDASTAGLVGPGTSYPGEMIEDEQELLLLRAWRHMQPTHREMLLQMLPGLAPKDQPAREPQPPPGGVGKRHDDI